MNNQSMLVSLQALKGRVIRVDRGGPESRVGMLLDVSSDYFAVLTEKDGIVYYQVQHCKSISENVKDNYQLNVDVSEDLDVLIGKSFKDLVGQMKYRWVRINRGGPEKIEGIIESISDDIMILVSNNEVIRLSMFHIRNISYGIPENAKEENKDNNENQAKNENKNKNAAVRQQTQMKDEKKSTYKERESEKTLTLEGDYVKSK